MPMSHEKHHQNQWLCFSYSDPSIIFGSGSKPNTAYAVNAIFKNISVSSDPTLSEKFG